MVENRAHHHSQHGVAVLSKHLTTLAQACSATEAILFGRTTFLVIVSSIPSPDDRPGHAANDLSSTRYERTGDLIKALKHFYACRREEFHALEMELPESTAVLDEMMQNAYIVLIVHDATIGAVCLANAPCDHGCRCVFEEAALRISV
jgi:Ras-related GTP-binding protein A/B